jgi:DnaJ-class molecular chaperone
VPTKSDQSALKSWLDVHVPQASGDFFLLLGVHKGSTEKEITERRNTLARLLHPDRWSTDPRRQQQASDAMATVGMAHTTLTVKDRRRKYMAELASGRSTCPTCKGEGYTVLQRGFSRTVGGPCAACGGSGLLKMERKKK